MLTAREIMTEEVITIRPEAKVQEAIDLLLSQQVSGLPVVDSEGQLIGIITEFGLLGIAYDKRIFEDTVDKHMTTEVITVSPDDSTGTVTDLCIVHRVRRIPVVENGCLVGLISRRDVLRAIRKDQTALCTG